MFLFKLQLFVLFSAGEIPQRIGVYSLADLGWDDDDEVIKMIKLLWWWSYYDDFNGDDCDSDGEITQSVDSLEVHPEDYQGEEAIFGLSL